MAGETILTIIGALTADPELRYTPSGAAVANFTVASNARTYNKQTNEWVDSEPLFMRCSAWKQFAENITESLAKGTRVIVQGRLKQRSYETRDGEKRTVIELDVEEIGPSLKFATAKVQRASRDGGSRGSTQHAQRGPANDDPWGGGSGAWGGDRADDKPPF